VAVGGPPRERHCIRLRECIDVVLQGLGDRLPADRIALVVDCDPGLEVAGSAGDWSSIFVNLVANSLKHGFKGREGGRILIQAAAAPTGVRVEYRDDGIGLGPEALARIFEPFYTTDLQHGMGLGMHLVYNLVTHRLGGRIQCESRPGEGIRLQIEIPRETAA
jgi:signal transduction histidine kinase